MHAFEIFGRLNILKLVSKIHKLNTFVLGAAGGGGGGRPVVKLAAGISCLTGNQCPFFIVRWFIVVYCFIN